MPRNRLFGLETEYAFSALGRNGQRLDRAEWTNRFMEHAGQRLPNLPDRSAGGMFLVTGGRFYRDSGYHPELTTPEVANPWDCCRYLIAGDRLLREVADHLVGLHQDLAQIVLSRSNVSYGAHPTTWACHESYGHRCSVDVMPTNLIPHLVSRIVFTGAGGFNNRSPGIEFLLSPRVAHIHNVTSERSQDDRGIYHTKDESLSTPGYHRLHVLCGESLCSDRSNWLRMATTALVVAMIEGGVSPGAGVSLRDPLNAFWSFARDSEMKAQTTCSDGRARTAVAIQRHYLELARRHARADFMPPWAPDACQAWGQALDACEQGPDAVGRMFDWAIKRSLFRQAAARHEIAWEKVPIWSAILIRLVDGMIAARALPAEQRSSPRSIPATAVMPNGPIPQVVESLNGMLREHGLSWEQFPKVLKLRQQLLELDTRFSEVGPNGLFAALDAAGVLDHRVDGVDAIDVAMRNPPAEGRAKLRGACVQRFAARRNECSATWTGVTDMTGRKHLNLQDPFCATETWTDLPAPSPAPTTPGTIPVTEELLLSRCVEAYTLGAYRQVLDLLATWERTLTSPPATMRHRQLARQLALAQMRRGSPQAAAMLRVTYIQEEITLPQALDWICLFRFQGLEPSADIAVWIERALRMMASNPTLASPRALEAFRDHYAAWLLSSNRLDEAREQVEAVRGASYTPTCPRIAARIMLTLAEIDRRQGRYDESHRLTAAAARIQTEKRYRGDLAEFALPMMLRLELDQGRRLAKIREAAAIQRELDHAPGEARSLLLEARVRGDREGSEALWTRLLDLQRRTPALANCRLMKQILAHWTAWTSHAPLPGAHDYFAGV